MQQLTPEQIKNLQQRQYLDIEDTKSEKIREERRIIHFISTPDLDRGRDVVMPKGGDFTDFLKTKTVYKNHNYDQEIGSNVKLIAINEGVKATTYFSKSALGEDAYQLHLEGVVNGWSIGFGVPLNKEGDGFEKGAIEWDDKTGVRTFNKWILYEYSSTGIPMNPNALDIAKSICKSAEMRGEIEHKNELILIHGVLAEQKTEIENLKTLIANLKTTNSDTEIKNIQSELKFINTTLTELVGNMSKMPKVNISKEIEKATAGLFYDLTGRIRK